MGGTIGRAGSRWLRRGQHRRALEDLSCGRPMGCDTDLRDAVGRGQAIHPLHVGQVRLVEFSIEKLQIHLRGGGAEQGVVRRGS